MSDEEFLAAYERYKKPVAAYFSRRGIRAADADDLTSTVFLKAWGAHERYQETGQLANWLFTIASNTRADFFRHKGNLVALDHPDVEGHDQTDDPDPSLLEPFLEHLTPGQTEVLMMHIGQDWSNEHIAEVLHMPNGAVRALYTRGLKALRKVA